MADADRQEWWTAAELAAAELPDIPGTKRGVGLMAEREGWAKIKGKVRRRKGPGGGMEYHWTLLPVRARRKLSAQAADIADAPEARSREEVWAAFETSSNAAQKKARKRLATLHAVADLEPAMPTKNHAVQAIAEDISVSPRSIWNWLERVEGVPREDWLAHLVDLRSSREKRPPSAPSPEFCAQVKSDFLRPAQPSFTSCYDRAARLATAEGDAVPPIHQVRRWYKATTSAPTEIYFRKGAEALRRYYPHQTRDKTAMAPLECIQGDYHRFDVFVNWPGEETPVRVQGVFFSDVYSGKMLAWRLDLTANSHTVQLALGDLIERYGVPQAALLDNGREFAAKAITGGTPTRFRFQITDEDIPGLLPMLGVKVHWATPYSGQSKPIERAFRDFCDRIAKHPAFEGAYTGNRPDAKPENYGERAIPLDVFAAVVAEEVEAHNSRPARRSEVAFGRSFNEVFNDGYAKARIRRATGEQRRLWLLRAEGLRADAKNGELKLHGSRYWSEWMYRIAGQKIAARFDPDDLHAGLHVYDLGGAYLGHASCLEKGGFLDVEAARDHARKRGAFMRKARAAAKAEKTFTEAEIAARLRAAGREPGEDLPSAAVIQLVTPHSSAPKARRRKPTADELEHDAMIEAQIARLSDHIQTELEDDPEVRFTRALDLEQIEADGHPLTDEQRDWLSAYQQSAEYKGQLRTRRALGLDE